MNRRALIALLAAITVSGALCAAAPHLIGRSHKKTDAVAAVSLAADPSPGSQAVQAAPSPDSKTADHSSIYNPAAHIRERAEQTNGTMVYILLLAVLVLSGLGVPIPEEIPLLLAGYKAWHGSASLYLLVPIGLIGVLIADVMLFSAARRWRSHIFRLRWIRATIRPRHLVKAREQFHSHGLKIVVIARWLPALRSAVCLTAGLTGVSLLHFVLVDATAAAITVPVSVFIGYFAANHIDRLITGFTWAEHTVLLIVLLAMAMVVLWWLMSGRHRRQRRQAELAKPLPSQDDEAWEEQDVDVQIKQEPARHLDETP